MSSVNIQKNIQLAQYTTFKIGGPAKFFCEARNENELEEAIKYARDNKLAAFVMGGGSNILVNDDGFNGLVVRMVSQSKGNQPMVKMRMENGSFFLECWAGESLGSLIKLTAEGSLAGLEWAAGIPGTIGGAVRGNAGAFGGQMADSVANVKFLNVPNSPVPVSTQDKFQIAEYGTKDCQFSYRDSIFKQKENLVIVSVVLKLAKGDKNEIEGIVKEVIKKRAEKQPRLSFSPGSYFKNPIVDDPGLIARFEQDTGLKCKDNKLPAGWLITEVGLRGKKIGNIQVSGEHGNFLINLGGGKATDVVMLSSLIKQKIRDELGVQLQEEVKYVGF